MSDLWEQAWHAYHDEKVIDEAELYILRVTYTVIDQKFSIKDEPLSIQLCDLKMFGPTSGNTPVLK
jgi:hypothetical protein